MGCIETRRTRCRQSAEADTDGDTAGDGPEPSKATRDSRSEIDRTIQSSPDRGSCGRSSLSQSMTGPACYILSHTRIPDRRVRPSAQSNPVNGRFMLSLQKKVDVTLSKTGEIQPSLLREKDHTALVQWVRDGRRKWRGKDRDANANSLFFGG